MANARTDMEAFRDPFLSHLCFHQEQMIQAADDHAAARGVTITDSNVRSAVIKARALTAGESPKFPEGRPRDTIVRKLSHALHAMRDELGVTDDPDTPADDSAVEAISPRDWIAALDAVEASIALRKSPVPGARDYLDYARNFLQGTARTVNFPDGDD